MSAVPAKVRAAVHARSGGLCECGCGQPAQHIHHRRLRSQGGKHDLANLLDLNWFCHNWIHANPSWAYERGFLVHSWASPADVPVFGAA